ncbi:MAG: hypothetical protein K0Q59_997 [Paenibacillus sp.]|nr:hypothetical protein [Paenibacillus sp.]
MKNGYWGKMFGGFILIAIGVLFFLYQADYIEINLAYVFSNFWPAILIIIGLRGLVAGARLKHGYIGSFIWSFIVIGVGLVFLNNNIGWIPNFGFSELMKYAVPALFILLGVMVVLKPRNNRQSPNFNVEPDEQPYIPKDWKPYSGDAAGPDQPSANDANTPPSQGQGPGSKSSGAGFGPHQFDPGQDWKEQKEMWKDNLKQRKREWQHEWKQWHRQHHAEHRESVRNMHRQMNDRWHGRAGWDNRSSFIGDVRIGREYWELRPLNISHFIGDTEIDLTRASIPFGETTINISSFIGDLKIYVPNDTQLEISVRASAFLGDMSVFDRWEGGLFRNMKVESPQFREAEKRIKVNVSTFIGDVRVKRVG